MNSDVNLDFERARRRGYPEAIYCEFKSPDQVRRIAEQIRDRAGDGVDPACTLFTRALPEHAQAICEVLPDAHLDETARLLAWPPTPPVPSGLDVVVACAGTSDLPVAQEALLTARYLGREARLLADIGVAGLHRTLARIDVLRDAGCIVVVAGMEGALASVVAGLVGCPVVAVPTSVGYGAAFEGLSALLGMLNACSPGVAVVNIDNGYGAGHLAAQITAPR